MALERSADPYRSVLYMPGSKQRALEKAKTLAADALILDLEDAVAPGEKANAREFVADAVSAGGYGRRKLIVRINALDTEWGLADLERIAKTAPDAVLLPKVETPEHVQRLASLLEENGADEKTLIWAMMETPRAMLNAGAIASSHARLQGFVLGTNDLAKDLGAAHTSQRLPLITGLGLCLLAARAEDLICVDGVYNAFKDSEGLRSSCEQGRDFGFDGKTLIHPDQIGVTNEVFAPSEDDVALAQEQVEAFQAAEARGEGVAVVRGRIVENLHVATARRLLARAQAIAELSSASG